MTWEQIKQTIKSRLIRYELKCSKEADEEADDKANTDIDAKADQKVFATRLVFRGHDIFRKCMSGLHCYLLKIAKVSSIWLVYWVCECE